MSLSARIRRGEGAPWSTLKRLALWALTMHVPVGPATRPLFGALYRAHVLAREGLIWGLRFFWYEPLFRSQCASIGTGLRMEQLPYMTGRGRLVLGDGVRLSGKPCFGFSDRYGVEPEIVIGPGSFLGHDCAIGAARSVRIGAHCLLAGGVRIADFDGHPLDARRRRAGEPTPEEAIRPVRIGDDVWVGARAVILKGVTIGDRSVVAAMAVVTKDVPPGSVVAGNPARVVKVLEDGHG